MHNVYYNHVYDGLNISKAFSTLSRSQNMRGLNYCPSCDIINVEFFLDNTRLFVILTFLAYGN